MIIYGKEGCPACEDAKAKHPDAEYYDLEDASLTPMQKLDAGIVEAFAFSCENGAVLPVFKINGKMTMETP